MDDKSLVKLRITFWGSVSASARSRGDEVVVPRNTSIRTVVKELAKLHGDEILCSILDSTDELLPYCKIAIDGKDLSEPGGLETQVIKDSEIMIAGLGVFQGG